MSRKTLFLTLAALLAALVTSTKAQAWGAYHAGFTHVGYGGVYHAGYTRVGGYGGYGGYDRYRYGGYDRYGYGGYRYGGVYGGYHYAPYYGGVYRYGYLY
jgi:hypothetical protein